MHKLKKIVLIDDSPSDCFLIQRIMREYPSSRSHQIVMFDNATEGRRYIQQHPENIELVLLDLNLPDATDGHDAYDQIKECLGNVPLIALTGSDNRELAMELFKKGMDDFVCKAHIIDYPDLLGRAIDFALCRHQQARKTLDAMQRALDGKSQLLAWIGDSH